MVCKVYVETSVVMNASLWFKVDGKTQKHQNYENPYGLLLYAEQCKERGILLFYTTPGIVQEAHLKLEKALSGTIAQHLGASRMSDAKRRAVMEQFAAFLYDCLDQLDFWFAFLQQETIDQRRKAEITLVLRDEFRTYDVDFRKKYGASIDESQDTGLPGVVRKAAHFVRTLQRKEARKEYKPNPGSADIGIMAEIAAINRGLGNEVYVASEDGHFCAKLNRKLLEEKAGLRARRSHELLDDGLIRSLIEQATPAPVQ